MSTAELEKRLRSVEREVAALKSKIAPDPNGPNAWVEMIAGSFSGPDDTRAFDQAMRYGRQWRNAQRPKSRKRKASAK
jgi:hypothetical protein